MSWSEGEFLALATAAPLPMEDEPTLPDRTKRAIFNILVTSREGWFATQTQKLAET